MVTHRNNLIRRPIASISAKADLRLTRLKKTGYRITTPRDQSQSSAFNIIDSKERVEQAKDIIFDIV